MDKLTKNESENELEIRRMLQVLILAKPNFKKINFWICSKLSIFGVI